MQYSSSRNTAPLIMRGTGTTHVGNHRERNEDRFGIFESAGLAFVADGMGGHAAGNVASRIAAECVALVAEHVVEFHDDPLGSRFQAAILDEAHERIVDYQLGNIGALGMGTTLTLAWLRPDRRVQLLHLGDSRAYLIRDGSLSPLTRDHSVVGDLVERGRLTREEARVHPQRNQITRYLGRGTSSPEPDLEYLAVQAGDRLLLCTDGLTDMVPEERIEAHCGRIPVREDLVGTLLAEALDQGGNDDITIVVVDVLEHDDERSARDTECFTLNDVIPLHEWATGGEHGDPREPHPLCTLTEIQRQWLIEVRNRMRSMAGALKTIKGVVARRGHLDWHSALTIFGSLYDSNVHTRGQEEA